MKFLINKQGSAQILHKQQQRPQSHMVTQPWHASKYKVHKLHKENNITQWLIYPHWVILFSLWSLCTLYLLAVDIYFDLKINTNSCFEPFGDLCMLKIWAYELLSISGLYLPSFAHHTTHQFTYLLLTYGPWRIFA